MSGLLKRLNIIALLAVSAAILAVGYPDDFKPVPESAKIGFESITAADAVNYVNFLASDDLEGRDTGSRGMRIARMYVAGLFRMWGVAPAGDMHGDERTYHQIIKMVEVLPGGERWLEVSGLGKTERFEDQSDVFMRTPASALVEIEAPAVFAGYGVSAPELSFDELAGVDFKGKAVLLLAGTPDPAHRDSPLNKPEFKKYFGRDRMAKAAAKLKEAGAACALFILPPQPAGGEHGSPFQEGPGRFDLGGDIYYKQGSRISPPARRIMVPALAGSSDMNADVTEKVADAILACADTSLAAAKEKLLSEGKPATMEIPGATLKLCAKTNLKPFVGGNVLGKIEGSDPELKKEAVVIGGHLDHLGIDEEGYVFNGADDNASGSAGVLETAQAFALNPVKPKRTVIFACWTGEEKGLYGSSYFVKFPTLKELKIVANLNMDMISRDWKLETLLRMARRMGPAGALLANMDEEGARNFVTSMVSMQCPEFRQIVDGANRDYIGLRFVCLPSAQTGGSDHAPFHQAKIPAIFFFSAMTEDYHQPGDTVDKVNGEKMEKIIRLVYLSAWEIANRDEALAWKDAPAATQ